MNKLILFLLTNPMTAEVHPLQKEIPAVVGEQVQPLPLGAAALKGWITNNAEVSLSPSAHQGQAAVRLSIAPRRERALIEIRFTQKQIVAERFRFWLKGDRSNRDLVLHYTQPESDAEHQLAQIKLDFGEWRHLEIPASNPIHRFHGKSGSFRILVIGAHPTATHIQLSRLELVTYDPMGRPIVKKDIPAPVFDSWGGPARQQIEAGKRSGVNMHISPIHFLGHPAVNERVVYADKAVRWCRELGILSGISFYNHPSEDWLKAHPELLVKRRDGEVYAGSGAFTSPWNPEALKLWRTHIIDCLQAMKKSGGLKSVDVVELCPGEEGEVSYQWDHVWAFDKHAAAAWSEYLRTLYRNDISRLNDDWASAHKAFDEVAPPHDYYPDRAHWVFADFYRLSMLKYCAIQADAVREVFTPRYWLWLPHSLPSYPKRFFAGRYPLFYTENLRRLGCMDYAHLSALDWHAREDVAHIQRNNVRVLGEIDVRPTRQRLEWTFEQSRKYKMDGVFIGVLEILSKDGVFTPLGKTNQKLIRSWPQICEE
ncbi:MAG: hypothetical protein QF437_18850 [Planctomycetota bacterium]|nr:hypothetical protein [Planctomycetota bacterium]